VRDIHPSVKIETVPGFGGKWGKENKTKAKTKNKKKPNPQAASLHPGLAHHLARVLSWK